MILVANLCSLFLVAMADKGMNLRFLLEKEKLKLDGSNFGDWYRNVRIALRNEEIVLPDFATH